ncbi:RNA methyltransferase [Metabacillus sp. GX 13764]|uniref:TrmH family RNA methyltransferase n=1 Tax=Metabacillus kandeliae TaxID=2900151 RepID=UPI001E4FF567|nr:RNA methyltransferase [Metabacillus kandeliae]
MKYIESVKNPKVKQWKKLHTKKERDLTGTFLAEGYHLVEEALKDKDQIVELIISEASEIPSSWNLDGISITMAPPEVLKAISDTETPQGAAAVCRRLEAKGSDSWSRVLMIDSLQDPGNLGTLIRTADAAGIDGIVLGEGTVDLYNSKVIRSSQGSIFHLPAVKGEIGEWAGKLKERGVSVYGTSLAGGFDYKTVQSGGSFALLIGNEGSGVSEELLGLTDQNLYIPIHGQAESLNAAIAAGILLYHLRG